MGGKKRAPDSTKAELMGLSAIASIETAAADPDSWRADAARRELKRKVIERLQEPSEAIEPSATLDVKAKRAEIRRLIKAAKAESGIEGSHHIIIIAGDLNGLTIHSGAESQIVAKRRWLSSREMLVNMVVDRGGLFGLSSGDLLKLAQGKFKIEIADLTDLSFEELGRLYDFVGRQAPSL